MDLRNSSDIVSWNLHFTTVLKLFTKIFIRSEKCIMWSSIQVLLSQVSKKSFRTFEDIHLRKSHAKLHKKPSETLGTDLI